MVTWEKTLQRPSSRCWCLNESHSPDIWWPEQRLKAAFCAATCTGLVKFARMVDCGRRRAGVNEAVAKSERGLLSSIDLERWPIIEGPLRAV